MPWYWNKKANKPYYTDNPKYIAQENSRLQEEQIAAAHKAYLQNNIVSFKKNMDEYDEQTFNDQTIKADKGTGWQFPGIREDIDDVEKRLAKARSYNTKYSLYQRLKSLDATITAQEQTLNEQYEDRTALMSYRRRVRMLMKKLREEGDV